MAQTETNKHGLTRRIPPSIKREVRRRCGFGCVRCGKAVIDYEHFDPPFHECSEHRAEGITLLCIECHGLKERGWIELDEIKAANAAPHCKDVGFSFGPFHIGRKEMPEVRIGVLTLRQVRVPLEIFGDEVFSIKMPEEEGEPFLITANLFDVEGRPIISIIDNEWRTHTENWDVQATGITKDGKKGGQITIHRGQRDIALQLRVEPPALLVIERLDMFHRGVKITCKEGHPLKVEQIGGPSFESESLTLTNFDKGFVFTDEGMHVGQGGGVGATMTVEKLLLGRGGSAQRGAAKRPVQARSPALASTTGFGLSGDLLRDAIRWMLQNQCPCGGNLAFRNCHGKPTGDGPT